jgi:hypothetical protein
MHRSAFAEPHRAIKRLKAKIERIAFSPIDPPRPLGYGSGRAVPTNSGFTISHIAGITGRRVSTSSWRGHPTTRSGAREKPVGASAEVGRAPGGEGRRQGRSRTAPMSRRRASPLGRASGHVMRLDGRKRCEREDRMRRRQLVSLLGGAAPVTAGYDQDGPPERC